MILTLHHPRAIDVDGEWAIEIVASSDDEHDYLVLKESVLSQIEELLAKRKAEPFEAKRMTEESGTLPLPDEDGL